MSIIPGFDFDYECISDGEAFQRNHEYGDNYIDVKSLKEVGDFKKLVGSYVKVFRTGEIKKIEIEKVTIGDFVIIEKGDIVPADAVVIESKGLSVLSLVDNKVIEDALVNKEVYQGMKVLSGKATIMVSKIGKDTFIGKKLVELMQINNTSDFSQKLIKTSLKSLIVFSVLAVIMFIFCLIKFWGTNEIYKSFSYAGIFIVSLLPVELIFMIAINVLGILRRLKINGIKIKNPLDLVDLDKIRVICVYDNFFNNKNVNDMQRLYKAGIRVIMLSDKNKEESKKIAIESGLVSDGDIKVLTGNEVKAMNQDELRQVALDVIVFSEMDSKANELVVKTLKNMGVPLLSTGSKFEDTVALKLADMGISIEEKRDNLESKIANAFVKNIDIKTILEMLRIARKFSDSLKSTVRYVLATRIPLILLVGMLIVVNKGNLLNAVYLIEIYWVLNTLFVNLFKTVKGNELLLDVEAKKNIFTVKDTFILILKVVLFTAVLMGLYFGLIYFAIIEEIIGLALMGGIICGCLIIAAFGKKKNKEKVIKIKNVETKINKEKPVKKVKEKKVKEKKTKEEPVTPPAPPEKPWVSDEENDKNKETKNNSKSGYKNRKKQRTEELKGKML